MVRTKKHFRPPSPSSSSSSSEEDEPPQAAALRGRGKQFGNFGRGKQLSAVAAPPAGGRGKQLRAPDPESEEASSDDDDTSSEEEAAAVARVPTSRGKQLRPSVGRGKQLRAPSPPAPAEEESDSSAASAPAYQPPPPSRGGKQLGGKMLGGRGGKQLRRQSTPTANEEDGSDSSSSEEEPWNAPRGRGKQLRPPPAPAAEKDESDMEESSEEEEEEEATKEPAPAPPKPAPTAAVKKPEPEEEPEEEEDSESDFEPEKKKPAPKRRGRPPARTSQRSTRAAKASYKEDSEEEDDEEEEEEEASDDDDDSSSEEETELDMETFDMQKLVRGDDDQKYLDSLNELERENILAERFEKLKSEADMKKALRENKRREREQKKSARKKTPAKKRGAPAKGKKAPAKKKKKAATPVDSDEEEPDTAADAALAQSLSGKRVSARNLDKKGKQFKKQAALAKIRENRANKAAAVEDSDSELDYGRDSDDSDDDYYEEGLKPWQQKSKKTLQLAASSDDESMGMEEAETPLGQAERRTEDVEADREDYIKVWLPRRRLMRWCNEPFFEKAVKNFYVRLGIGRDHKTQQPCYRLCKILGVENKKEYSFPPVEGQKPVSTGKWLKCSFGKHIREFKMITASDHRPSEEDVIKIVSQLKTERQSDKVLTKKAATKLRKRQDELVNNYTYTKEDIDMLVEEKKKRNKKALNIAVEKTRIAIAVQAARDEVEEAKKRLEDAEVARMEADDDIMETVEESVTAAKEALELATKKLEGKLEEQQRVIKEDEERVDRLKKSSKVQNWVKVNQRAKMANRNADFQAYLEEQAKEKAQGSAEPKFDPYARRRQKPKNLWEVGGAKQSDKASEATGSSGVAEEEKKETAPSERDDYNVAKDGNGENKREDNPDPNRMELPGQADQFAFDDDIVIGGEMADLGGIGAKKVRTLTRKGISLEDYQERKSAGTL